MGCVHPPARHAGKGGSPRVSVVTTHCGQQQGWLQAPAQVDAQGMTLTGECEPGLSSCGCASWSGCAAAARGSVHVGSVAGKGFRGPGHQSSSDANPRAWMHALLRECLLPQHMGVVLKPPQHLTTKTRGWLEFEACKLRGLWGISV